MRPCRITVDVEPESKFGTITLHIHVEPGDLTLRRTYPDCLLIASFERVWKDLGEELRHAVGLTWDRKHAGDEPPAVGPEG
jgi:hypothetical protein